MKLAQRIELLHRSSGRMMALLAEKNHDATWWELLRRESWIHLKRAFETWWHTIQGKE